MHLSGLSLQHFRSYTNKTVLFSKPLTIILAPNASGKTNILEAINLLSTGESFRAGKVDDFIKVGEELARVKLKAEENGIKYEVLGSKEDSESVEIELLLNHGVVSGKRVQKKILSVNGVKKQRRSVLGLLPTIAFIPEDLRLITGSPSRRREFLNTILMQIDQNYASSLTMYDQTLRRRNKLLLQIREGKAPRTVLSFWDMSLLKHGMYLQKQRVWLIDQLNKVEFPLQFQIEYDCSIISPERLKQYEVQEVIVGHTMVGPHKDDIIVKFQITNNKLHGGQTKAQQKKLTTDLTGLTDLTELTDNNYPLSTHGSRGQQRMGVLWMKLGAFEVIRQKLGKTPLLLLDDIFSELDRENRLRVLELAKTTQTIMTSAEEDILLMEELKDADIIRI